MATVTGTSGDDSLTGDQNGSTQAGLEGDDTLTGDNGRDTLFGGSGHDSLYGGNNDDYLEGGEGSDSLDGGDGQDTMYGGADDDSLFGERGSDTMYGGDGSDSIDGGNDRDTIYGGEGDDTVTGGAGDDHIEGEAGNDFLSGGEGHDTVYGGAGNDTLYGGDEDGQDGADLLYGGAGDDTLHGNGNDDSLYGGTGDDHFIVVNDGTSFNKLYIDGGEDAGDGDVDVLDLSEFFAADPDTQIIYEVGGPGQESGRILLKSSTGQEYGRITYDNIEAISTTPICFTPGTLISTPTGDRAVETLREGDTVYTRDNGVQKIRWAGRRDIGPAEMAMSPKVRPVLIRAGALGHGQPERDLLLSPNHRVLLSGLQASLYFGEPEILAAVKHLTGMDGIDYAPATSVSYIHLLFDRHEVIFSNGAWSESFQPGEVSLQSIRDDQRSEIFELFPELALAEATMDWAAVRPILKKHEARLFSL